MKHVANEKLLGISLHAQRRLLGTGLRAPLFSLTFCPRVLQFACGMYRSVWVFVTGSLEICGLLSCHARSALRKLTCFGRLCDTSGPDVRTITRSFERVPQCYRTFFRAPECLETLFGLTIATKVVIPSVFLEWLFFADMAIFELVQLLGCRSRLPGHRSKFGLWCLVVVHIWLTFGYVFFRGPPKRQFPPGFPSKPPRTSTPNCGAASGLNQVCLLFWRVLCFQVGSNGGNHHLGSPPVSTTYRNAPFEVKPKRRHCGIPMYPHGNTLLTHPLQRGIGRSSSTQYDKMFCYS